MSSRDAYINIAYHRWLAETDRAGESVWWLALMRALVKYDWTCEPEWTGAERAEFLQWGFLYLGPQAATRAPSRAPAGTPTVPWRFFHVDGPG